MAQHPNAIVLLLGDNAYNHGTVQEYADHYKTIYGSEPSSTFAA